MYISLADVRLPGAGIPGDTAAVQAAIDRIGAAGGGQLLIPAGRYHLGGLRLPSNFTLHLAAGAELIASADYQDFAGAEASTVIEQSTCAFLYARQAENITITGTGTINGHGAAYFAAAPDDTGYRLPNRLRPRMIVFEGCRNIRLTDFSIIQAPMWTVHLLGCNRVIIDRLTIDNDLTMSNTDAIDLDGCRDVSVSNSIISAADDCICLKTTRKPDWLRQSARNIVVSNCLLRSKSCAIKLGTETVDDIEDVLVNNCTITDSNRAIGLVSRDGGRFRRLIFSNLTLECTLGDPCHWGKADPIYISVRSRLPEVAPGDIVDVRFRDLFIQAEGAINIHADRPEAIRDVVLFGIRFHQRASESPEAGLYDLRPPCNPQKPGGGGLDNAYLIDPESGRPYGVYPYPGGLPAVFIQGGAEVRLDDVSIARPDPLPAGWNPLPVHRD